MGGQRVAVAVVALVVLAGCGGGGSSTPTDDALATPGESPTPTGTVSGTATQTGTPGDSSTSTRTHSDSSTPTRMHSDSSTRTPATDLEPLSSLPSLPPGVTEDGLENVSALLDRHETVTARRGYQYEATFRNASKPGSGRVVVVTDAESRLVTVEQTANLPTEVMSRSNRNVTVYLSPEEGAFREPAEGTVSYAHGPSTYRGSVRDIADEFGSLVDEGVLVPFLDWRAAGVETTPEGDRRLVLRADAFDERRDPEGTTVDARMAVSPDGVVRSADVTYSFRLDSGLDTTVNVSYRVTDVSVDSVSRPEWADRPPQLRASTAADGRILVLEHVGGAAIPANTTLEVGHEFTEVGAVATDRELTAGDTVYLYRAPAESTDEPPRTPGPDTRVFLSVERPTVPADTTAFPETVDVTGRVGQLFFGAATTVNGTARTPASVARLAGP